MTEVYPNRSTFVGDLYYLKAGVAVKVNDALVKTGVTVSGKDEVTVMTSSYATKDVIGLSANELAADYPYREITVLVKGSSIVKVAKAVVVNDKLQAASNSFTETFSGDATAQQEILLANVPVGAMVSLIESTPTTLTKVTTTPTTNEYSIDLTTGKIIIGGTSVSGTNNYTAIYTIVSARLEPLVDIKTESLVVTSNVATLTESVEEIEYIEATTADGPLLFQDLEVIPDVDLAVTSHVATLSRIPVAFLLIEGKYKNTAVHGFKPIKSVVPATDLDAVQVDAANRTLTFHATDAVQTGTVSATYLSRSVTKRTSFNIIKTGTVRSGEAKVSYTAKTITFAAGDNVTAINVRYKTANKACARALETKSAGELCRVMYEGVNA